MKILINYSNYLNKNINEKAFYLLINYINHMLFEVNRKTLVFYIIRIYLKNLIL